MLIAASWEALVAADTVNIAVAANFAATLERVKPELERVSGQKINIISGSSGRHYAQIMNGGPFDLFLSADATRPAALERAGRISSTDRRVYALGRLALWSRDSTLISGVHALENLNSTQRIAIANPKLAPYGIAAIEALEHAGLHARLQDQLVMGENVGQAFQFAYSGSAALGFLAYSQVLSAPEPGSFALIPDNAYTPIVQEMALLKPTAAARILFAYLSSPAMTAILEEAGYYSPTASAGSGQ